MGGAQMTSGSDEGFPQGAMKLWTVYMLPLGVSEFNVQAGQLWEFTAEGRTTGEVFGGLTVRAAAGTHYVLDLQPHGVSSPKVMQIQARARRAADDAERARFSRDGRDPEIARIIGSRPLGGG